MNKSSKTVFNKHLRGGFRYMENHNLALHDMLDKKQKIMENNLDLEIAIAC